VQVVLACFRARRAPLKTWPDLALGGALLTTSDAALHTPSDKRHPVFPIYPKQNLLPPLCGRRVDFV